MYIVNVLRVLVVYFMCKQKCWFFFAVNIKFFCCGGGGGYCLGDTDLGWVCSCLLLLLFVFCVFVSLFVAAFADWFVSHQQTYACLLTVPFSSENIILQAVMVDRYPLHPSPPPPVPPRVPLPCLFVRIMVLTKYPTSNEKNVVCWNMHTGLS